MFIYINLIIMGMCLAESKLLSLTDSDFDTVKQVIIHVAHMPFQISCVPLFLANSRDDKYIAIENLKSKN